MKMALEIVDRHGYLNIAYKKSAKSNVSRISSLHRRHQRFKNKVFLLLGDWSVPNEEGGNWKDMKDSFDS